VRGWMCLFGFLSASAPMATLTGNPLSTSGKMATALFLGLFVMGLLTRVARGRAW